MNADLNSGKEVEQDPVGDDDIRSVKELPFCVRSSKGDRINKAVTKIEEKKKIRMARQEQVYLSCYFI